MIVALTLVMLMGFLALGIDVASLYRERHKLQTITDLAVLSAVPDPARANERVTQAKSINQIPEAHIEALVKGRYLRNPAIPPEARFLPLTDGAPGINAISVRLRDDAPLSFARILTEDDHVTLRSTALAARTGAVSFSLDTALAQLDGDALHAFLNRAFMPSADLAVNNTSLFASTDVPVGDVVQALAAQLGFDGANPADILNRTVTPSQIMTALRTVSPDLAGTLNSMTGGSGDPFMIAEIVGGIDTELGLTIVEFLDTLQVSSLDILMAVARSNLVGEPVSTGTQTDVAGLLTQSVSLVAGEPPAQSGWIAIGETGVTLHRAALRVGTETELDPTLLGPVLSNVMTTRLSLPIYLELAGATATLDAMSCSEGPNDLVAEFITTPTPLDSSNGTAIAALYIGDLSSTDFASSGAVSPSDLGFADILDLEITLPVPLLPDITVGPITVQMRSTATIGQSGTERVSFTRTDIEAGRTTKRFGSENALTSGVASLMSEETTEFRIKPGRNDLRSGLPEGLLDTIMSALPGQLAQSLTAPVDGLLDATLASIGVELGTGHLTVEALHCERAQLVR